MKSTRYIKKKVIIDVSFKDEIFIGDYPPIPTILLMSYFIISYRRSILNLFSFFFKKELFQNRKHFHVKFILFMREIKRSHKNISYIFRKFYDSKDRMIKFEQDFV